MMKKSPWNTDDIVILRQKWRLANDTATNCERLQQELELMAIRVAHVGCEEQEHQELSSRTRKIIDSAGKLLFDSGLVKKDWAWFAENVIPDGIADACKQSNICQRATDLPKLIASSLNFVSTVAEAKRKFSDALKIALNSKEESEDLRGTWFQETGEGVQIYEKLVHLGAIEAKVLLYLCQRSNRLSEYPDFAGLRDTWEDGLDSAADHKIKIAKSNIRTCLGKIRRALQDSFKLSKDQDPLKLKRGRGWKLDKDLLQNNS